MKVLLLSPYLPAINTSACARKIFDSIKILKQNGHVVNLISFCSQEDEKRIGGIGSFCAYLYCQRLKDYARYPLNTTFLKSLIKTVCAEEGIDILQCEKSYLSRYIPEDIKVPCLLVEHEILSASFQEQSGLERGIFRKIILSLRTRKKTKQEAIWYRKFRKIVVFSTEDRGMLKDNYGLSNVEVIPLGINLQDYPYLPGSEKEYDLIFGGNFSHSPNVDAMLYFCRKIFPLIKSKLSAVSLVIAGAHPSRRIRNLAKGDKNITVTGYVDDITGCYKKAKVLVAPIRYGAGMRFKILEAMALGVPAVTTSLGARGIPKECLLIADKPEEFCRQVVRLLGDSKFRNILAAKARVAVEEDFNLSKLVKRYEEIYGRLAVI
jgi:glycosyltransferase involved in cell wall biosynthesis